MAAGYISGGSVVISATTLATITRKSAAACFMAAETGALELRDSTSHSELRPDGGGLALYAQ
jgi:hypothetical protein